MIDKKDLIVYKENIFVRIKKFFKNIFRKNVEVEEVKEKIVIPQPMKQIKKRDAFIEFINFKENKEELKLINGIRKDTSKLYLMDDKELDKIEKAILNRQKYVDKMIEKLKTDLMMKKIASK